MMEGINYCHSFNCEYLIGKKSLINLSLSFVLRGLIQAKAFEKQRKINTLEFELTLSIEL